MRGRRKKSGETFTVNLGRNGTDSAGIANEDNERLARER